MLRGVLQGQFSGLSAQRHCGRRNLFTNQSHCGFAQNACGLAFFVFINLSAVRIRGT